MVSWRIDVYAPKGKISLAVLALSWTENAIRYRSVWVLG